MRDYFTAAEMLCKCGRPDCEAPGFVTAALLDPLNALRERVGHPLIVTSGLRCAFWNQHEGGADDSEHLTGEGVDLATTTGAERWDLLRATFAGAAPLFTRIGIGRAFVHFGVSVTLARGRVWHYYPAKEATA